MRTDWGRPLVVLMAVALVATACARRTSVNPGPSTVGDGLTTSVPGGAVTSPSSLDASHGTGPSGGRPASGGSGGSPAPGGGRVSGGPGGSAASNPVATHATGGPGALARDLLQPQPAGTDVLEIEYQPTAAPDAHALDHVRSTVASVSGKSTNVTRVAVGGGAQDWSSGQLRTLADQSTQQQQGHGQAVIHLLYLHGTYNGDTSVLGITVRADVIAVFKDQVAAAATPVAGPATVEDAVTMHEVGHVLGLVDLVLHTGRADPAHPGHSTNRQSVMYWAVDSDLFSQVLNGPPPVDFDHADLADLATLRRGG